MAPTALTIFGFSRVPTGFIPVEDQGYMLATVQLPDGASLSRTQAMLDRAAEQARKTPGVDKTLTIAGVSPLDNNASLSNTGVVSSSSRLQGRTRKSAVCYR
jgi:HAE1 family hydrophobic/amphiphilic exporter-1